jgi:uncharacterized Zn finger protein
MKKISAILRNLTLDDLREWAGTKILSRGKSYVRNVKGLSRTKDGTLAAWVSGSEEYATSVHLDLVAKERAVIHFTLLHTG